MLKFKTGDTVLVTIGKDKGRSGKIEKVFPKSLKVVIPEINISKKHVKGKDGVKGGIYDIAKPLPFSKIALVCPNCKKRTRVGFEVYKSKSSEIGEKVRVCKKCKKEIK